MSNLEKIQVKEDVNSTPNNKQKMLNNVKKDILLDLDTDLVHMIYNELREKQFLLKSIFPLEKNKYIKGLSHKYSLPKNISEHDIWSIIQKDTNSNLIDDIYKEIVNLNPDLKTITTKEKGYFKRRLVGGVASRLPICDIKYFIEELKNAGSDEWKKNAKLDTICKAFIDKINIKRYKKDILLAITLGNSKYEKYKNENPIHPWFILAHTLSEDKTDINVISYLKGNPLIAKQVLLKVREMKFGAISFIVSPETFFTKMLPMIED